MLSSITFPLALSVAVVPEPSTLTLVALGGAAGLFLAWRNKRKQDG